MRSVGLAIAVLVLAGACGGTTAEDPATETPATTATATAAPSNTTEMGTATTEPTETPTRTPVAVETGTPPGDATETPTPAPAVTSPAATNTPVPPAATATTAATATPAFPQSAAIELSGSRVFRFVPEHVEIRAGGSVTWRWVAGPHNVVGDGPINHPAVESDAGYAYTATFPAAGTYAFTCEIHPDTMNGTVTVR